MSKKQSLLSGSITLFTAVFIVKIMGILFKIPLANILGGVGMSYFFTAYDAFLPVYSLTAGGLTAALARIISRDLAKYGEERVYADFISAKTLAVNLGLLGTLILIITAPLFLKLADNEAAFLSLILIAPSVFFMAVSSAYRGCFQGMSNMRPTAFSQVTEAFIKLTAGISLPLLIMIVMKKLYEGTGSLFNKSFVSREAAEVYILRYGAAGAAFAVTLSTAAGMLFISARFKANKRSKCKTGVCDNLKKEIIKAMIPVSLSMLIINMGDTIDLFTAMAGLGRCVEKGFLTVSGTSPKLVPEYLYGLYAGMVHPIFSIVPSVTAVAGVAAMPQLAESFVTSEKRFSETVNKLLFWVLSAAVPGGLGLFTFADYILKAVYPLRQNEADIVTMSLRIMGIAVILISFCGACGGILQSVGRERVTLKILAFGSLLKLILNLIFVENPKINITGISVSNFICYLAVTACFIYSVMKYTKVRIKLFKAFAVPLFAAVTSFAVSINFFYPLLACKTAGMVGFTALTAIFYAILLTVLNIMNKVGIKSLKNSKKTKKRLAIIGFIR